MRIHLFLSGLLVAAGLLACQQAPTDQSVSDQTPVLKSELRDYERNRCVDDSNCIVMDVTYPVLRGGNDSITSLIMGDIEQTYRSILDPGNRHKQLSFTAVLDSSAEELFAMFKQFREDVPESAINEWTLNANGNVPVLNDRILTVEVNSDSYLGGAHPNYSSTIKTYDLGSGKALGVADLISNQEMVRKMLEAAYREEKGLTASQSLSEVLFEDTEGRLPMPGNIAVAPDGIRFYYNDYEIAPHAVGPADLLLKWEALGEYADKKRWLE